METFIFCKFLLKLLCLWPIDDKVLSVGLVIRYMVTMTFPTILLIGLFLFVVQNLEDVNTATETGFACFAFATSMFIYCWLIKRKPLINIALTKLEAIVNERIGVGSTADGAPEIFYRKAEHQYTKLGRRYFLGWISIVCFYGMTLMVNPIMETIHGNADASTWATLFKAVLPIDSTRRISFMAHFTLDFAACFVHFTIYSASSTFHMATTIYVSAMVLDVKSIWAKIDKWKTKKTLKPIEKQMIVNASLVEGIKLHSNILQLTKLFAAIMSGILFIIIANSIVFMAIGLFQMETKTKAAAFEVYVSLNSVMLQGALIWFFCYHSSLASSRLAEIAFNAYKMSWYEMSVGSQRSILLIIQRSNCPFAYSGFGIWQCNLQTLSMMINSVVSYYLLLKQY